jgi:hypothetical protein
MKFKYRDQVKVDDSFLPDDTVGVVMDYRWSDGHILYWLHLFIKCKRKNRRSVVYDYTKWYDEKLLTKCN